MIKLPLARPNREPDFCFTLPKGKRLDYFFDEMIVSLVYETSDNRTHQMKLVKRKKYNRVLRHQLSYRN